MPSLVLGNGAYIPGEISTSLRFHTRSAARTKIPHTNHVPSRNFAAERKLEDHKDHVDRLALRVMGSDV